MTCVYVSLLLNKTFPQQLVTSFGFTLPIMSCVIHISSNWLAHLRCSRSNCVDFSCWSWDTCIWSLEAAILEFPLPLDGLVQHFNQPHCIAGPQDNMAVEMSTSWDIRTSGLVWRSPNSIFHLRFGRTAFLIFHWNACPENIGIAFEVSFLLSL